VRTIHNYFHTMSYNPKRKKTSNFIKKAPALAKSSWRKARVPRPMRIFNFTRLFSPAAIAVGTSPFNSLVYDTQLAYLPNSTEFTNLFDCYRINSVTLRFDWSRNSADLSGTSIISSSVNPAPLMYSVLDYDDNVSLANSQAAQQYGTCKLHNFAANPTYQRTFTPLPAINYYKSAIATSYGRPKGPQWIDTGSPDTPHYGLKVVVFLSETSSVNSGVIYVQYTVNFSCKDTR